MAGSCYQTPIKDCVLFKRTRYEDNRGYFEEFYNHDKLLEFTCKQINFAYSTMNVIRGIHVVPFAKLVSCVQGAIFDVCVDLRRDSPTYLQYYKEILSEKNGTSLYIPAGCGHGLLTLQQNNVVVYCQNGCYDPKVETILNWQDDTVDIDWPEPKLLDGVAIKPEYIVSEKDKVAPFLNEFTQKIVTLQLAKLEV